MKVMKTCKICKRNLPDDMFDENRHQCRDCRRKYGQQRRKDHPEIHRKQESRRIEKVREWINSLKTPCIVCGEKEVICIDFHHINPEDKKFTIGRSLGIARNKLLEEIKKCVCVCSNCHRKIHAGLININDYISKSSS